MRYNPDAGEYCDWGDRDDSDMMGPGPVVEPAALPLDNPRHLLASLVASLSQVQADCDWHDDNDRRNPNCDAFARRWAWRQIRDIADKARAELEALNLDGI